MQDYKWAFNKIKLQRALATAQHSTEESIKERYIELGGLVREQGPVEPKKRPEGEFNQTTGARPVFEGVSDEAEEIMVTPVPKTRKNAR